MNGNKACFKPPYKLTYNFKYILQTLLRLNTRFQKVAGFLLLFMKCFVKSNPRDHTCFLLV